MGIDSATVAEMHAAGAKVRAMCTECRAYRDVDLRRLIAARGQEYRLFNRRCRCRLTPGCTGWNRFFEMIGYPRRMWDDRTDSRWIAIDWQARCAADPELSAAADRFRATLARRALRR